ncbi:hypothetical protein DUI87_17694 [Hirundo rustica rustica]|uniref:Reverse transcriptase domain-containing protein n=1 Tax=Hirundo rustica rustica TaxID=333673 RepID=A0A3M0JXH4_HIRRU|nr:hypothetical protein DUI87_17694 [Hirundo rustica rustica]
MNNARRGVSAGPRRIQGLVTQGGEELSTGANSKFHSYLQEGQARGPRELQASLTLSLGTVIEQLILETISRPMKDKTVVRSSQCGSTKEKSCLVNLTTFYSKMSGLADGEKAVDVSYLDSATFDAVSHKILI